MISDTNNTEKDEECCIHTETEILSYWQNFHHWLHRKLSKWQLPVQPVMKISSIWRHFRFSAFVKREATDTHVGSLLDVVKQPLDCVG